MEKRKYIEKDEVVIRFSGDSGDGMQLTGSQFTETTAALGTDVSTLPDFPAEIRAIFSLKPSLGLRTHRMQNLQLAGPLAGNCYCARENWQPKE